LLFENYSNKEFIDLTEAKTAKYKRDIINKPNYNYRIFPSIKQEKWMRDNYGRLIITKKGMKICLTKENIDTYKSAALKFENVT